MTWILQVSERSVYYLKLRYLLFNLRIFFNHPLKFSFFFQKIVLNFLGASYTPENTVNADSMRFALYSMSIAFAPTLRKIF